MDNRDIYNNFDNKMISTLIQSEQVKRSELGNKYGQSEQYADLVKSVSSGVLDISDPLFSAFTIEFDFNNSPLLMNTTSYINRLNNMVDSDKSLASAIESNLDSVHSSVGDPTSAPSPLLTLDKYFTTTNPTYSAVDYIYLIDKEVNPVLPTETTPVNQANNVTSMPNQSDQYDRMIKEIDSRISLIDTQISDIDDEIAAIEADENIKPFFRESKIKYHNNNKKALGKQKESLENQKSSIKEKQETTTDLSTTSSTNNDTGVDNTTTSTGSSSRSAVLPAPSTVIDLVKFGAGLKELSDNYPYVFQAVEGLDTAYSNYYKTAGNNICSSGDDKISITCVESVDMRISTLFNRYLNTAYDHRWKRDRLPINMRKFNCTIYVHDTRTFLNTYTRMGRSLLSILNNDSSVADQLALSHLSVTAFHFYDCEIIPEDTANIFDSISNADGDMKQTKLVFKYNNAKISFINFTDILTEDNIKSSTFESTYNESLKAKETELYSSKTASSNDTSTGDLVISGNVYGSSDDSSHSKTSTLGNAHGLSASSLPNGLLRDVVNQGKGLLKMGLTNALNENVYEDDVANNIKKAISLLGTTNPITALEQGLIGKGIQILAKDKQKTLGDMTNDLIQNAIKPIKSIGNTYQ